MASQVPSERLTTPRESSPMSTPASACSALGVMRDVVIVVKLASYRPHGRRMTVTVFGTVGRSRVQRSLTRPTLGRVRNAHLHPGSCSSLNRLLRVNSADWVPRRVLNVGLPTSGPFLSPFFQAK